MTERSQDLLLLAEHYLEIEEAGKALEVLSRTQGQALEDAEFYRILAQCYLALDQAENLEKAVASGLELDPDNISLLFLASEACRRKMDLAGAERAVLKALNLDPENPLLLCHYGLLVGQAGQFEKAERLLERAEASDPESSEIIHYRYALAIMQGKDRKAAELADRWVAQNPDDPDSLMASGLTLASLGRMAEGRARTANAVGLSPEVAEGHESDLRDIKVMSHWSLWILAPFNRFGPGVVWVTFIVVFLGLQLLGFRGIASVFAIAYLLLVIYSWVAPRIVRHLLRRGQT
jgi:predicted Zn-dependent protease